MNLMDLDMDSSEQNKSIYKMTAPKVTIALLTFNRPEYLKLAIEAVLTQTFKDYELIIMDNGSDPETYNTIKPYINQKIRYHRNPINNREYGNLPFVIANGKYLIITHDDDIMMPAMLEKEVNILDSYPDVAVVGCGLININTNGDILKNNNTSRGIRLFEKYQFIQYYLETGRTLPCPTVLMRLDFLRKHNLKYDISAGPAVDVFLWFNINLLPHKLCLIEEPLYFYRIHPSQDGKVNQIDMEFSLFDSLNKLLIKHRLNNLIPLLKEKKLESIMSVLTDSFVNNRITKITFEKYLLDVKKSGLDFRLSKKSMLRILIFRISPILYKKLFAFYSSQKSTA